MKRLNILLFLLLAMGATTLAQNRHAAMQLKLRDNNLLTVVIDGRQYNKYGYSLTVGDLPAGVHELKVYRFYPAEDGRGHRRNRANASLAYKGNISLSPATMYYCTIDGVNRTMSIRESRNISYTRGEKSYDFDGRYDIDEDRNDPYDVYDYNYRKDNEDNRNDRRNSRYREDEYRENRNEDRKRPVGIATERLSENELYNLKSVVDEHISDEDKREVMEGYLKGKKISTQQVLTMSNWLTFENTKLKFVKNCYPNVLDKENYLELSKVLSFRNSKQELESFIFENNESTKVKKIKPSDEVITSKPPNSLINQNELTLLGKSVQEKLTDTDKQKLMREYLAPFRMTASQVGEMLEWFTFEGSKLEFAKWAFPKVNDPAGYILLKGKFNFSSSKKEIENLALSRKR